MKSVSTLLQSRLILTGNVNSVSYASASYLSKQEVNSPSRCWIFAKMKSDRVKVSYNGKYVSVFAFSQGIFDGPLVFQASFHHINRTYLRVVLNMSGRVGAGSAHVCHEEIKVLLLKVAELKVLIVVICLSCFFCRAKYFRGKKLNGECEIRVEQVCSNRVLLTFASHPTLIRYLPLG